MHIVLTVNFSPWSRFKGGAQYSIHYLAEALVERGHEVDVFFTKGIGDDPQPDSRPSYHVNWVTLPVWHYKRNSLVRAICPFFMVNAVRAKLRDGSVVMSAGDEAGRFGVLNTSHDVLWISNPRDDYSLHQPKLKGRFWEWVLHYKYAWMRRILSQADACASLSTYAAERLETWLGFAPAHHHILPNGLSPSFIQPSASEQIRTRRAVYYGRLTQEKGVLDLLDAWRILGRQAPPLTIIGSGELEPTIRTFIADMKTLCEIELLPWASQGEIRALLERSTMAILPSSRDTFGNTIAESMACGVTVIASKVGAAADLIRHSESGWLVEPKRSTELAAAIAELDQQPDFVANMGKHARQFALDELGWDKTALKLEQWINTLVTNGKSKT